MFQAMEMLQMRDDCCGPQQSCGPAKVGFYSE